MTGIWMKNKDLVFLDTSALIALLNPRDQYHPVLHRYLEEQKDPLAGVTTNLVLAELLTFFSRHGTLKEVLQFQSKISRDAHVKVVWIDQNFHESACRILEKFSDQRLSFTDAVSFAIMKREGITQALAFDDDFTRAGFQTIP